MLKIKKLIYYNNFIDSLKMFITGNIRISVLVMIKPDVFSPLIDICIYILHLVSLLGKKIVTEHDPVCTPWYTTPPVQISWIRHFISRNVPMKPCKMLADKKAQENPLMQWVNSLTGDQSFHLVGRGTTIAPTQPCS